MISGAGSLLMLLNNISFFICINVDWATMGDVNFR